jgi:Tol biopolymer transport system component
MRAGARRRSGALTNAVVVALVLGATSGCAYVNRFSDGRPANEAGTGDFGAFGRPALSGDGRYAAYAAQADAHLPGATNFVVRRANKSAATTRVDVSSTGEPANDQSLEPAISADGRFVAFSSYADNLAGVVPGGEDDEYVDQNFSSDIFVRDIEAQTTVRVSVATDGEEAESDSYGPSISADGRYIAFTSDADNLDPADGNGSSDLYVHDRIAQTTKRVSIWGQDLETDFGAWDGVISADGKFVAFSTDTDLAPGDNNDSEDVYLRDLDRNVTKRVSPFVLGGALPAISGDGHYVAFVDVNGLPWVRDTVANTSKRVLPNSNATAYLDYPAISNDGRFVAFTSSDNVLGTDTNGTKADVYVRDMVNNRTTIGSATLLGAQVGVDSYGPALSGDGKYVGWYSPGAFEARDTNGLNDIYMRATLVPAISSVSPGTIARGSSVTLTVTGSGFSDAVSVILGLSKTHIKINSVTPVSDTTLQVAVTVPSNAKPGSQGMHVVNKGSGGGFFGAGVFCGACLSVT